jgi:hypothetical protein
VRSEIRTVSLREVGRHVQLAGRQQAPDVRYAGHAGPQIDNAAIPKGAKTCTGPGPKSRELQVAAPRPDVAFKTPAGFSPRKNRRMFAKAAR